jgi:hypothetical protein
MLAYHVKHARGSPRCSTMRPITRPMPPSAPTIVAKAERSDAANRKQTTGRTADGMPVHSWHLVPHAGHHALNEKYLVTLHTNPMQRRAFELLGINPDRTR